MNCSGVAVVVSEAGALAGARRARQRVAVTDHPEARAHPDRLLSWAPTWDDAGDEFAAE
jgi:hypothetical protein